MASYDLLLLFVGLAILGAVALPRIVSDKPMSFPILYIAAGMVLFALPLGAQVPNPVEHSGATERLTELVVIIALTGAGLKIDRPFDLEAWGSAWRLLGITMPLTIFATAYLAWEFLGAIPATAVLLGAVIAPTDPVLASDVQATPPNEDVDEEVDAENQEGTIRFALTSEAGLNDGLAFPFTFLAIAIAGAGGGGLGWLGDWALMDLGYRVVVGTVMGYVAGRAFAWFIFSDPEITDLAKVMSGAEALALTLVTYAVTELIHGYGFIAVFVAALVLRHYQWDHEYYLALHDFAVTTERLLMAAVLLLFGGAITGGLLSPLTVPQMAFGVAVVLLVRPIAGMIGFLGSSLTIPERFVVSSFGIRGIGSFFYLAFALEEASFQEAELLVAAEQLWAILGFVVIVSAIVHGVSANYVMDILDRYRPDERTPSGDPEE